MHNIFYKCVFCSHLFDLRIDLEPMSIDINIRCSVCGVLHTGHLDIPFNTTEFVYSCNLLKLSNAKCIEDSSNMHTNCELIEISASNLTIAPFQGKPIDQIQNLNTPSFRTMTTLGNLEHLRLIDNLNNVLKYRNDVWPNVQNLIDILYYKDPLDSSDSSIYINNGYFKNDFNHNYADCFLEVLCDLELLKFGWSEVLKPYSNNLRLVNKTSLTFLDSRDFRILTQDITSFYIKPAMLFNSFNLVTRWFEVLDSMGPTILSHWAKSDDSINYSNTQLDINKLLQLYVDTFEFCGSMIHLVRIGEALIENKYDKTTYFETSNKSKGSLFRLEPSDLELTKIFKSNFNSKIRNSIGHYDFEINYLKHTISFYDINFNEEMSLVEFSEICCKAFDSLLYAIIILLEFKLIDHFNNGLTLSYTKEYKVGRNELCPCHSLKKYKYCHGKPKNRASI